MSKKMIKIKLGDYIDLLTDYHSGGSYQTLRENTKILHEPSYAKMVRTLNFESDNFENDLVYVDEKSYNFLNYCVVNQYDVFMNKIANPGSVYIMPFVDGPTVCGMNLFQLRFKNVNQRYMYYVMKYNEEYIKAQSHGTTTKTITKNEVKNLSFNIHEDKNYQNKIVNFFGAIDSKIYINKKIINKLDDLKRDLYNYWFLQFEFPNMDNKPYKSNNGVFKYNEELKKEIPSTFKVKKLLDIISWEGGSQPPKSTFIYEPKDGYIRFIQNRDYSTNEHLTYIKIAKNNKICDKYDIMMDKYGDAGKIRFGIEGAYNVALSKIGIKGNNLQEYIRLFLGSDSIYNYLHNSCMASTRASLNEENLSQISIVVPDNNTLEKFEKISKGIIDKELELMNENKQLVQLKNVLLPQVISGKLELIQ